MPFKQSRVVYKPPPPVKPLTQEINYAEWHKLWHDNNRVPSVPWLDKEGPCSTIYYFDLDSTKARGELNTDNSPHYCYSVEGARGNWRSPSRGCRQAFDEGIGPNAELPGTW